MKKTFALFLIGLALSLPAEVRLDPLFSSDMVLQQGKPVCFFGTAAKEDRITVEFAGKKVNAETDPAGNWKAVFPAMKASYEVQKARISDGKKTIDLENLLIGDVWFCSGQSNMQMPIGAAPRFGWSADNCVEEVKKSFNPHLRYAAQHLVRGQNTIRPAFLQNSGKWVVSSPKYAANFSACAYFFGRALQKELNIPIGIINSSWGGSRIQGWISQAGYKKAGLREEMELYRKFDMTPEERKAYEKREWERFAGEMSAFMKVMEQNSTEKQADPASLSGTGSLTGKGEKLQTALPSSRAVIRCYWTRFRLNPGMKGKVLRIQTAGFTAEGADVWLNGKKIASWKPENRDGRKVLNARLKPEMFQQDGENVLTVRAVGIYPGKAGDFRNLIGRTRLIAEKQVKNLSGWEMLTECEFDYAKHKTPLPKKPVFPYYATYMPSTLFNGMVQSWTRLPIKGVIWYQGCSNSGEPRYYLLHKALIADWRAQWKEPEMPFLIVQLAGYGDRDWQKTPPCERGYALTRDIQLQMKKLPAVGVACAIDIGHPYNIHPANKQEVGRRLSLEAFRIAYGKKLVSCGPLFREAKPEGKAVRIFFDCAENGLVTSDNKPPRCFAVAGADRQFVWAEAKIDGKTVLVSSPSVPEPKYVRYAYAAYRGDLNLRNKEGLPAYPFRSDAYDYSAVK